MSFRVERREFRVFQRYFAAQGSLQESHDDTLREKAVPAMGTSSSDTKHTEVLTDEENYIPPDFPPANPSLQGLSR